MVRSGTGIAVATGAVSAPAPIAVSEVDVAIHTASGICDAALVHPLGSGAWPAAIMFPDAFGLRPTMRDMARRLAAEGYTVLVPNPFYRLTKAPGVGPDFDFQKPEDRARLSALRTPLTNENVMRDASAFVAFLDTQPFVSRKARMGVVGYCMGGLMTMQAAAGVPDRIGAGASFHGGGLVTDKLDSPHRLVQKMRAEYYFGIAANDDERQPEAKTELAEAFKAAKLPEKIEVYEGTLHGWCIRDMPIQGGRPIYDELQAERAWGELLVLFRRVLT
ncbi:dienelactone hydrolase family protein [Ferrovum sp.]|jgi:carboxymethylenebutenolidase|uniref:dienelactone hydrolase family protein n=1 Tax=Ferrovum sp. TaxID=2609467 RepID=UPI002614E42F|nr:dienelactone hydrolase family protein [Ferrovum sp.]